MEYFPQQLTKIQEKKGRKLQKAIAELRQDQLHMNVVTRGGTKTRMGDAK